MNYLQRLAQEIQSHVPSDQIPGENADDLFLSYALLAESKGAGVTNRDVHDAWVAWMTNIDPDHESLVPYDQLDPNTQQQDTVFTKAIKTAAARQSG